MLSRYEKQAPSEMYLDALSTIPSKETLNDDAKEARKQLIDSSREESAFQIPVGNRE